MINIVLFGPPGAGKGTQSIKLKEKYKLTHLSTGDIFRSNIKNNTDLGKRAKTYMDAGELVPDKITIEMLESEIDKNKSGFGFIFDGFPRTSNQATVLDEMLHSKGTSISLMLALEVDENELKNRLLKRAETSGRVDDSDQEIIKNRIAVYKKETLPVQGFYQGQGKYAGVDGIGSIDEIFERLCEKINQVLA